MAGVGCFLFYSKSVKFPAHAIRLASAIAIASSLTLTSMSAVEAVAPTVKVTSMRPTLFAGQSVTLKGSVSRSLRGKTVRIDYLSDTGWKKLASTKSNSKGAWKAKIHVPVSVTSFQVRAVVGKKKSAVQSSTVLPGAEIVAAGPGNRILGVDISRWQHSSGHLINFAKMATAGTAFVIMKASDGSSGEDALARSYVLADAQGVLDAGMIRGYYHMAKLPTPVVGATPEQTSKAITDSAIAQAHTAADRLAELGGYDGRTLPYVLDIEGVSSSITDASISLWTTTWYSTMLELTQRKPMIYSYRSFMQDRFTLSDPTTLTTLQSMHLWMAQPGDPADPAVVVGQKSYQSGTCYATAWTKPGCNLLWTFWQYTNTGDRELFGIPWKPASGQSCPADATMCFSNAGSARLHLDVDVFSGTAGDLNALLTGNWDRSPADFQ